MKTCKHCGISSDFAEWADKRKTLSGSPRGLSCQKCQSAIYAEWYNTVEGRTKANSCSALSMKKQRQTLEGANRQAVAKRKYHTALYGKNPIYTMTRRLRALITASLRAKGYSKTSRTHEILGASFEEVMQRLGCVGGIPEGYEIDHVIPMALAFDEASAVRLNHHTNLQLLTVVDNLAKQDKLPNGINASSLTLEEKKAMFLQLITNTNHLL